jgi:hypothetical protein
MYFSLALLIGIESRSGICMELAACALWLVIPMRGLNRQWGLC